MKLDPPKQRSQISYLIAQGLDKGVVSYDYLSMMADEYDISTKELNGILWEFISEGYIEAFIEVRCPQCGAHAGDYKSQEDIPEALICKDCG